MKTQRDCPQPTAGGLQPAASALGPPGSTANRSVHALLNILHQAKIPQFRLSPFPPHFPIDSRAERAHYTD